jgi:hypothetical protein
LGKDIVESKMIAEREERKDDLKIGGEYKVVEGD